MATQFRKSKSFGPFRVTASKSGLSYSAGVKGIRVSKGADGKVRRTVGIPGTGIYDTKVVGGGRQAAEAPATTQADVDAAADRIAHTLVNDQTPEQQQALYSGYLADPQATLRTVRDQLIASGLPGRSVDTTMPGVARYMDRWTGKSGTVYQSPTKWVNTGRPERDAKWNARIAKAEAWGNDPKWQARADKNEAWKARHPRLWKSIVWANIVLWSLLVAIIVLVSVA